MKIADEILFSPDLMCASQCAAAIFGVRMEGIDSAIWEIRSRRRALRRRHATIHSSNCQYDGPDHATEDNMRIISFRQLVILVCEQGPMLTAQRQENNVKAYDGD